MCCCCCCQDVTQDSFGTPDPEKPKVKRKGVSDLQRGAALAVSYYD